MTINCHPTIYSTLWMGKLIVNKRLQGCILSVDTFSAPSSCIGKAAYVFCLFTIKVEGEAEVKMCVLLLQPFGAKNQHLSYSLLHTSLPSPIHTMLICVLFSAPSQPSPPPFSPPNYKALSAGLSVLHWGVQGIGRHMAVWSFYAHPHRKPPWISTYFRDNVLVSFKC